LKDSNTEINLNKKKFITVNSKDDYSIKAALDILQSKFIKRSISLKAMKVNEVEPACGGRVKLKIDLQSGISKDNAKLITKLIKDSKLKVSAQIMDEIVRVQGAKKDDLQEVMRLVKEADYNFPVQFVNYK
jgi:uncharacterized protein YajQ (UPF0234 family)